MPLALMHICILNMDQISNRGCSLNKLLIDTHNVGYIYTTDFIIDMNPQVLKCSHHLDSNILNLYTATPAVKEY